MGVAQVIRAEPLLCVKNLDLWSIIVVA
jgi:hypothetical protein